MFEKNPFITKGYAGAAFFCDRVQETKEGRASSISGGAFIRKHRLPSASSVLSAVKGLLEKDFVSQDKGVYWVYD